MLYNWSLRLPFQLSVLFLKNLKHHFAMRPARIRHCNRRVLAFDRPLDLQEFHRPTKKNLDSIVKRVRKWHPFLFQNPFSLWKLSNFVSTTPPLFFFFFSILKFRHDFFKKLNLPEFVHSLETDKPLDLDLGALFHLMDEPYNLKKKIISNTSNNVIIWITSCRLSVISWKNIHTIESHNFSLFKHIFIY